ncbi:MAG: hypothetical protein Q8Q38_03355 [bacterium]|nr:hypothetical protein [bacterium]MDZ4232020.1 hypothetical protein [Candidatus Pacearchaeota archaeon]
MTRKTSLVFALGAIILLFGMGVFIWQRNSYSKDVVRLEVLAPKEVEAGEEITYKVTFKNNGNAALENVRLSFEFPKGSAPKEGGALRKNIEVDDIYPGQEGSHDFAGRLFGAEQEVLEAAAELSYTPRNLTATFRSKTIFVSTITFVPLTFEMDVPSRAPSDQQIEFSLNYFSNIDYPLSDLRIQLQYPDSFEFQSSTPVSLSENEWALPLLNRADGGRISVKGVLRGSAGDDKLFRALMGTWKEGEFTVFKEVTKGVEVVAPQLFLSQVVNGSVAHVASPGEQLNYEIYFKNVSDKSFENFFLVVDLSGRPLDSASVVAPNGSFSKSSSSIIWEAGSNPSLRFLGKGEEGSVSFSVKVRDGWDIVSPQEKNFAIHTVLQLSDVKEEFDVKVNSELGLTQSVHYQDATFSNSGPLPPQVGQATTYTVLWRAENQYNDVRSATVRARLPQGVEMTGSVFPIGSPVVFDSVSREVVWEVGGMGAASGILTPAPSVAFQVRQTPTASQLGTSLEIISEARITAEDDYTGRQLFSSSPRVTTNQVEGGGGVQ